MQAAWQLRLYTLLLFQTSTQLLKGQVQVVHIMSTEQVAVIIIFVNVARVSYTDQPQQRVYQNMKVKCM